MRVKTFLCPHCAQAAREGGYYADTVPWREVPEEMKKQDRHICGVCRRRGLWSAFVLESRRRRRRC